MLKSILIFCLALICTLTKAQNQAITINNLSSSINQVMANEHIPGLMVGIATKDSIVFTGGFGYSDIRTKQPVTADNLFRLGSVTKMFVSLAILQLMDEHKISLNDRLKAIAPEIPFTNEWEANNPVRIVNLLEHTSGFDDLKLNAFYNVTSQDLKGLETVIASKKSLVCRWKPGERCSYCNPNYVILAYLVEKISGIPYDQYIAKNILQPLNMTATNFNLRITDKNREVKEYIYKNWQYEQIPVIPAMAGGDGGLKSSANDMIKFVRLFLNNGKPLFKAGLIDEMETPHSSLAVNAGLKTGYALANETFAGYNKYLFRGHKGIAGSCYTTLMYNRALGCGFIIASNGNNDMEAVSKLIISFLEQNKPARIPTGLPLNKTAIAPYLGFYQFESPRMKLSAFSDRLKVGFHTFIKNDTLYLKELSGNVDTLIETGPLQFAKKGMNATQYAFLNNRGKNVMLAERHYFYFEQTNYTWAIIKRGIILVAVLFALSSLFFGVQSLISFAMGKVLKRHLLIRIVPMLAMILLLCGLLQINQVQKYSYLLYQMNTINERTLIIFLGTLLFGVLSVFNMVLVIKNIHLVKSWWLRYYLVITACSLLLIAFIFFQAGWIGLRPWV